MMNNLLLAAAMLVADCAGADGTLDWMLANNIVAELDYSLFTRWAAEYGRPLAVEMRPVAQVAGLVYSYE